MPITRSAKKALRVSHRKRVFNLRRKTSLNNAVKEIKKLVGQKNIKEARAALSRAYKAIDKATKKGVIKKNNASRKKSRLSKLIKKIS
ncbi:MAG TPA: 30S ribosomal protein S20 [Candidatus Paceibacterota bacterium]|nr:30S ribosomal protein S20 [Candidatus Paceibacterota bacterium]